ncbi:MULTISPECIES: DUF3501 family protein [unclassified Beijerinckia]|uniref:DUF3501 family protein n=1 Tax=unclassified Beijerinckia TaxID=2638183 RepID=UPI00089640AE|nr:MULTISPECIES: DUF3501 family protein [unclassified Beijerinckia]MDH7795699.1 hypothetical protein [Beijerinckia sp. GAS462]SEC12366.1 Protein of unknown function [Beijerinckia sp. 28-YEA-48]
MAAKHQITAADIVPWADYAKGRIETRKRITQTKRNRRVDVGPNITFYFENFETMWLQVQEMLHIERGGEEQLKDELAAYNPLIPQGQELVATFMIEIDEPERRKRILGRLGGIEETAFVMINGEKITGKPEEDQDRTTEAGKASSVQFVHFPFSAAQIEAFKKPGAQVILGLGHENYNHMAVLTEVTRAELAKDFD